MGWKEWGILIGILVVWVVLTRWVLPWCGVPTCCSARQCSTGIEPAVPPDDSGPEPTDQRKSEETP